MDYYPAIHGWLGLHHSPGTTNRMAKLGRRPAPGFLPVVLWLYQQADFPEMLRFVMLVGGPDEWTAIAGLVAARLPRDEAFALLVAALGKVPIGRSTNIAQGIAETKHPEAEATLRRHLEAVWAQPGLWDDDEFLNWLADEAMQTIQHLLEIGANPADFEARVRQLSAHVCSRNRESCVRFLFQYYPWLR